MTGSIAVLAAVIAAGALVAALLFWVSRRYNIFGAPSTVRVHALTSCAHCGAIREIEDLDLVSRPDVRARVCHPADSVAPGCYELVTAFGESVGDRQPGRALHSAPMPWESGYEVYAATADTGGDGLAAEVLSAVFGVLADHCAVVSASGRVYCTDTKGVSHASFPDQAQWRRHVGPLFIAAIDPAKTSAEVRS